MLIVAVIGVVALPRVFRFVSALITGNREMEKNRNQNLIQALELRLENKATCGDAWQYDAHLDKSFLLLYVHVRHRGGGQ